MSTSDNRNMKKRKILENNKDFVTDGLSTPEIRRTVQNIRAYIEKAGVATLEDRVTKLREEHSFFAERYPVLFDMCIRPNFHFEHLDYFLRKRDEIINDTISTEDASKTVGKEWFEKFVDVSKLEKKK